MANTTGKKYGGRQKGTPNRMTKELRSILKEIIYQELNDIEKRFEELEPKTRIELLIKMMPFILPKTNAISHKSDEPIDFEYF